MPHLIFGGRYYRVAADELPLPMVCVLVGRVIWTGLLGIALAGAIQNTPGADCATGWYALPTYLEMAVGIFCLSIVNCACICWVGLTGLIFETEKRTSMNRLLRVQMVVMALELLCAAFGVAVFVNHCLYPCAEGRAKKHELALILIVMVSQVVDFIVFFCCCCSTRSKRIDKDREGPQNGAGIADAATDLEASAACTGAPAVVEVDDDDDDDVFILWVDRMQRIVNRVRCFCCNILGGKAVEQTDLESVARIMTSFFHHSGFLDVVPGDALAGLMLVRMLQRKEKEKVEQANPNPVFSGTQSKSAKQLLFDSVESGADDSVGVGDGDSEGKVSGKSGRSSPRMRRGSLVMIGNDHAHGEVRGKANAVAHSLRRKLSSEAEDDRAMLEDISDLMPYCLSMYTALFVALMNPCTFACRLCASGVRHKGSHTGKIDGDHYGIHKAAAMHHLRHVRDQKSDLVYGNFSNTVLLSPYCIFIDHEKRRVVVAIRGTLSVEDAVTDVMARTVEMTEMGEKWGFDGTDRFAHEGIMKSADFIRSELDKTGVLEKLFSSDTVNTMDKVTGTASGNNNNTGGESQDDDTSRSRRDKKFTYELSITGHSLGAGLASMVAYMLRPRYPLVKCVAFAPPASVFDQATAVECKEWMTSVVLGDDCVPRLNMFSLIHMRDRVLDTLVRAKVSKARIFRTHYKDFVEDDFLFKAGEEPDSPLKRSVDAFKVGMQENHELDDKPQCTVGGRIIHFVETGKEPRGCSLGCRNRQQFTMYETSWEAFLEIPATRNSLEHHWPDLYLDKIDAVRKEWGIDK